VKKTYLLPEKEGNYLIDFELPKKLFTSYQKRIEFEHEMSGSAEIVTDDLCLIERFLLIKKYCSKLRTTLFYKM
jgi:hypothetical protein